MPVVRRWPVNYRLQRTSLRSADEAAVRYTDWKVSR